VARPHYPVLIPSQKNLRSLSYVPSKPNLVTLSGNQADEVGSIVDENDEVSHTAAFEKMTDSCRIHTLFQHICPHVTVHAYFPSELAGVHALNWANQVTTQINSIHGVKTTLIILGSRVEYRILFIRHVPRSHQRVNFFRPLKFALRHFSLANQTPTRNLAFRLCSSRQLIRLVWSSLGLMLKHKQKSSQVSLEVCMQVPWLTPAPAASDLLRMAAATNCLLVTDENCKLYSSATVARSNELSEGEENRG